MDKKIKSAVKEILEECQNLALKDKWLIIFGPSCCKRKFTKRSANIADYFVGYKMENEKFDKIV